MANIERADRTPDTPFFRIMAEGEFIPANIHIEIIHNSLRRNSESERLLEENWQKWPGRKFPNDSQPSRLRVAKITQEQNQLLVQVDPCVSYRDFIGSRAQEFAARFGEDFLPRPAVVAVLTKTSDYKLLIGLRKIADYKSEGLGVFGGFAEFKKDTDGNGNPSLTQTLYRELKEELCLEKAEVINPICMGATFCPFSPVIEFDFTIDSSLTSGEILNRRHDLENETLLFDNSEEAVKTLIKYYSHAFPSTNLALLYFYGKSRFGDSWAKEIWGMLELRSRGYGKPEIAEALERRDKARIKRRYG